MTTQGTSSHRVLWLGLLLSVSLAGAAAAFWLWPRHPSVILITIDTLRPDRLACYGHPTNKTPALDRLAREGVLFERAYCDMPWTTGSMASVMTGRYSNEHGLRDPTSKLDPNVVTLAQILHERGFQTGAVVGSFPLDSIYGLDRGFETYDDEFSMPMFTDPNAPKQHVEEPFPDTPKAQAEFARKKQHTEWYRPDEGVTDAAIHWLDVIRGKRPFFLWVHYFGPHEKLDATRNYVQQEPEIIARYDGDVEATDRAVGRLVDHLRTLGILDDTMLIVHADHGQNLGENEYVGHTLRLDEVAVQIPLIVRYPRLAEAGTRQTEVARNIDIVPTVLGRWNSPDAHRPGRSLLPHWPPALLAALPEALKTKTAPLLEPVAYFETYLPLYFFWPQTTPEIGTLLGPMLSRGVRTSQWKLLTNEYRGACTRGSSPARNGVGTWVLQGTTPLPREQCAQLGATELFRESGSPAVGLELVHDPPPEVLFTLNAEIHKRDDRPNTTVGQKFELSTEQEDKLKSLGYLQ